MAKTELIICADCRGIGQLKDPDLGWTICVKCWKENTPADSPVCQDCGEKALPGYVAGDRCERLAKRNACVPATVCGGRLDEP